MSFRRNIGAMALSSIIGQLALIATGIIAARGLGPVERGFYAIVTLVPLVLSQLILMGLPIAITYFIASDSGITATARYQIKQTVMTQVVIAFALFSAVLFTANSRLPSLLVWPLIFMVPASAGIIIQEYAYATLQGLNRFNHVAIARALPVLVYAVIALGLWAAGAVTLVTLSAAWSVAYCASGIIGALLVRSVGIPAATNGIERQASTLFQFGRRAFIGTAAPMDSFRLDQIFGSFLLSPSALGIYVVAQAFSALPKIVASNAGHVIYADTAKNIAADKEKISSSIRNITKLSLLSGGLCLLLIAALPRLNLLFFGPEFAAAALPSQILIFAAWIGSIRRFFSEFAKGLGRPEIQTISELAICLLVGVLAWLLCPHYGFNGLSFSMLISQIIVLIGILLILLPQLKHSRKISIKNT